MLTNHRIVDRDTWIGHRRALLEEEKALTRQRDALAAERRALPWVRIAKPYAFDTNDGPRTLEDLFDGRSQLIVNHFMMGPDWTEGCASCSFWADNYNGIGIHLEQRDVTLVTVARAPLAAINTYVERMGWITSPSCPPTAATSTWTSACRSARAPT